MYLATIESRISGIPCLIGVKDYFKQEAQGRRADSDWDCYGYSESDWDVLDRKGYKAKWLEKKLTSKEEEKINTQIEIYMEK